MKGLRGRILKNLKAIPQVKYIDFSPSSSSRVLQEISANAPPSPEDGRGGEAAEGKENMAAAAEKRSSDRGEGEEEWVSRYRRPDMNSPSLFDPDLLAAFRQAVAEYRQSLPWPELETLEEDETLDLEETLESILGCGEVIEETLEQGKIPEGGTPEEILEDEETLVKVGRGETLEEEERRPSKMRRRNEEGVVLYTTSLGGIRKTFEDCNKVRSLLSSLRVVFDERDLAMHLGYRDELRTRLGGAAAADAVPPRLFVGGTLVGGADRVQGLHERGELLPLLRCAPVEGSDAACGRCAGARFVLCGECSGSCKVFCEREGGARRCSKCNENGLVVCLLCRSRAAPDCYAGETHACGSPAR